MANQDYVTITVNIIGDGASLTATIVLDSTPLHTSTDTLRNWNSIPNSVSSPTIKDANGQPIVLPATATLSKSGKQVLITFSSPILAGTKVTVTLDLGYNI
jgi:hypothetical protein